MRDRPTLIPLLVLIAMGFWPPPELEGQVSGLGGAVMEADLLYFAGEPGMAFERLEDHLSSDPSDYAALWRAARSAVVLGIREEGSRAQNAWLDPAILFAERAVEVSPEGVDGIYWRGVAAGRRAMNAGPRYAVELAEIVRGDARAILAVDSLHGGAHNMLGKLNYEVMSLSVLERLIARTFLGGDALDDTSWEAAERHLRTAVEAWPDFVLFHFDLAKLYSRRDRQQEALNELGHVLALTPVHPTDASMQEEARALVEAWDAHDVSLDVDPVGDHGRK